MEEEKGEVQEYDAPVYGGHCYWVSYNKGKEPEVDCWEARSWGLTEEEFYDLAYRCRAMQYEHEFVYGEDDHKLVYDTYFKRRENAEHFLELLRQASNEKQSRVKLGRVYKQ